MDAVMLLPMPLPLPLLLLFFPLLLPLEGDLDAMVQYKYSTSTGTGTVLRTQYGTRTGTIYSTSAIQVYAVLVQVPGNCIILSCIISTDVLLCTTRTVHTGALGEYCTGGGVL